jgi:hypothetical protein
MTVWPPVTGLEPLVVPVLAAVAFRIVDVAALVRLVTGIRPTIAPAGEAVPRSEGGDGHGRRRPVAAVRAGVAGAPQVVLRTVGLSLAPLGDRAGLTWTLLVAGVVLAAAAPLYIVVDSRGRLDGGWPDGR